MTDTNQAVDTPAPDANAPAPSQEVEGAAAPSPAAKEPGEGSEVVKGLQGRFDELTRYRREAERERDHWRELAMRQQPSQQRQSEPAKAEGPKTLADFEFDETKYQSYLRDEIRREATEATRKELKEQSERDAKARRFSTYAQRAQEFAKDKPDFVERTTAEGLRISDAMGDAITESEDGPALAYYLANNPAEAERIFQLSPASAGREIGKLEAKLAAERAKAAVPKVSNTPPPTPKLEGAGDPAVEKEPSQMTDTEFAKWRKKQIAARR
jgi:hypothetical protein